MVKRETGLTGRRLLLATAINVLLLPAYSYAIDACLTCGELTHAAWKVALLVMFAICLCWQFHATAGAILQTVAIATVLGRVIVAHALSPLVRNGLLAVVVGAALFALAAIAARIRCPPSYRG
jgi:hypothetical protein